MVFISLMRSKSKSVFLALVAGISLLLISCAHKTVIKDMEVLPEQGPVHIELKPQVGYRDVTDYRSRTVSKKFEKGEITSKTSESVDFTVETKVKNYDDKKNLGTFVLTTLEKEGQSDLSDYAMPELGESLEFVLSSSGEVERVGDIPRGTIYYIPPVSLPKDEVKVGDTWTMAADWVSAKSGIPMRIEVISVLKAIRNCGQAGQCADIEISGDVSLIGAKSSNISSVPIDGKDLRLRFRSEIKGRIFVSIAQGTVLYSVINSRESLNGVDDTVQIASCMTSAIREPESHRVVVGKKLECDPNQAAL